MAERQLFIYKIQPVRQEMVSAPTADEQRIVGEHFEYLERLTQQGIVHLAGRTLTDDYAGFGIIIFSAESGEAAHRLVQDDPAIVNRLMRAEVYPFRAALIGTIPASE